MSGKIVFRELKLRGSNKWRSEVFGGRCYGSGPT